MNRPHTWGSIFNNALRRGDDHGYAAFTADRWEARQLKVKTMTTKVTIKNHGPDMVKVETVEQKSGNITHTLHVAPDQESKHDLYVYDDQVVRVSEDKSVPIPYGA